jgi:hypothetical protein
MWVYVWRGRQTAEKAAWGTVVEEKNGLKWCLLRGGAMELATYSPAQQAIV